MKRTLLVISLLLLAAGCQTAPAPSPGMAGLHVKVIAEPKAGVKLPEQRVQVYDAAGGPDLGHGQFERVDYSDLDEIVVWVEPANGAKFVATPVPPVTAEVDPKKPASSLARAVCVGQRIIFHNHSAAAGNCYSVSDGNDFDLGSISAGGRAEYTVRAAGLIEVLSDLSKEPIAQLYAAPTRWVSTARSGSAVDFNDLPPGNYKILSWHPRLPGYETAVTLSPNQVATASIKVGVNALPKVGK